jgi:hypothetical protein
MTDTHNNKAFVQAGRDGRVLFNPMSSFEVVSQTSGTGYVVQRNSDGETWSADNAGQYLVQRAVGLSLTTQTPPVVPYVDDSLIASSIGEVATDVRSDYGRAQFDIWEDLAEADQTIEMLSGPVHAAKQLYARLKGKSLRDIEADIKKAFAKTGRSWKDFPEYRASRLGAEAANRWLQFRLGIMPLVNSINNVSAALKESTKDREVQTWKKSLTLTASSSGSWTASYGVLTFDIVWSTNHTVRVTGVMSGKVRLNNAFKLGLCSKSLFTLPWELVRASFVADWFGNIGSVIGSFAPSFEATELGSCLVRREIISTTYQLVNPRIGAGFITAFALQQAPSCVWTVTETRYTRGDLPPASFVIRNNFRMWSKRGITGIALLYQEVAKRSNDYLLSIGRKRRGGK